MSRNIWIISDTHFGHERFLTFKDENSHAIRPFKTVKEMDECMVTNWNETVKDGDSVYHLGDVYFGDGHKNLSQLKGRKRLVVGNHDNLKSEHLLKTFEKIMLWRIFKDHNLILTHVPLHESQMFKVDYNLHGHIHEKESPTNRHINMCVEKHNYTPVHIDEYAHLMTKLERE